MTVTQLVESLSHDPQIMEPLAHLEERAQYHSAAAERLMLAISTLKGSTSGAAAASTLGATSPAPIGPQGNVLAPLAPGTIAEAAAEAMAAHNQRIKPNHLTKLIRSRGRKVKYQPVYNALSGHRDVFVKHDDGTWGLMGWVTPR